MTQAWYETIDDYAIALWDTNRQASTWAVRQWLIKAGISNPVSAGVLVGANALALAALVALDPAELRTKGTSGRSAVREIKKNPEEIEMTMEMLQEMIGLISDGSAQQALVKDDEGIISIV